MQNTHFSTKEVIVAILQGLGMVILFFALLFAPEIYKAFKSKPSVKIGKSTQFAPNNLKPIK